MSQDYSEQQLKETTATVNAWYEAFARSADFARLTDSQQRKAGAITDFFARYTCEYLGLAPGKWSPSAVEECCTELLPRKVSAEVSYFEATAPVLSAFFTFLGDQGMLARGRELAKVARGLHEQIVASAVDRTHWGPAKSFVMAAHEAGVDIGDEAALRAFMIRFNLQQLNRTGFSGALRPFSLDANGALGKGKKLQPSVGPYDPCPCGSGRKYKFCCKPGA